MSCTYAGDKKRINHFIKVHGYAKAIGTAEELDERTMLILETAAYVHDIGIKISEEKYNSSAGKYQEIEGPPIAEEMLTKLGYDKDVIERVSYLVGHHHTYSNIFSRTFLAVSFVISSSSILTRKSASTSI